MLKRRVSLIVAIVFLTVAAGWTPYGIRQLHADDIRPVSEIERSEIQMWRLINSDRLSPASAVETRGHAQPLVWDARLAAIARQHSEEMAANNYFSHEGMDGSEPYMRVTRAGLRFRATGENIAKFPDITRAEAAFMNEPRFQNNHRGNILSTDFTHVGVGIAKGPDGMLYITQEFASYF